MIKKIIFFIELFLIISNFVYSHKISCDFTEDIIMCIIENLDEIEDKIYYEDIGYKFRQFSNKELNFFEYLRENIITNMEFNENIFIENYNNLLDNIPPEINKIFSEYPILIENGYKYYINFGIYLHLIIFENIFNGNINKELLTNQYFEEVNIENIKKIKSLFNENDNNLFNEKTDLIIDWFYRIL